MCAEYYARTYRHYQTYVREYGDNKIAKIACGPNVDDYHWTKVMMEHCHSPTAHRNGGNYRMDGLSLHYYTVPGGWEERGSAVVFDEEKYYQTLAAALRMDELVRKHSIIMDEYDQVKSVGLVVDEWGTWYDVAEGTNPGFLYQQNTMRDAIVAGLTLNIFNKHCDRVKMANLAQTVNVLQAVILTLDDKMIKTPTYHVFDLYKGHHDAWLLESDVESQDINSGEFTMPDLHVSTSLNDDGLVHATLVSLSSHNAQDIKGKLVEMGVKNASARILTEKIDAHNDFDIPERVKPQAFDKIEIIDGELHFQIPPCAVMEIIIEAK
jgi:alpha-N-arabinofuranosidase